MSFTGDLAREREHVERLVRHASASWAQAMQAHKLAPPDSGFASRLQALSEAAATEQVAWEQAAALGLGWRPVPGAEHAAPPYELRPDTGRRGPEELWLQFDAAVAQLNRAISQTSSTEVAAAFGAVAESAADLAEAIRREDVVLQQAQARALPRHVA